MGLFHRDIHQHAAGEMRRAVYQIRQKADQPVLTRDKIKREKPFSSRLKADHSPHRFARRGRRDSGLKVVEKHANRRAPRELYYHHFVRLAACIYDPDRSLSGWYRSREPEAEI